MFSILEKSSRQPSAIFSSNILGKFYTSGVGGLEDSSVMLTFDLVTPGHWILGYNDQAERSYLLGYDNPPLDTVTPFTIFPIMISYGT